MITEWLWAFLITILLWFEACGWGRIVTRFVFPRLWRQKLLPELTAALGIALTAQGYFLLSLTQRGTLRTHLVLNIIGVLFFFFPPRQVENSARLHFKTARTYSLKLWQRNWPWLTLPILWTAAKLVDCLEPHSEPGPLVWNLHAPHRWVTLGSQSIDPLDPLMSLASIWEALYSHIISLATSLTTAHRVALMRAQISAQMTHFIAGELLCIVLVARLVLPFLRSGWDKLVHLNLEPAPTAHSFVKDEAQLIARRHQLGMASSIAWPSALFFSWLASASCSRTGTLAGNEWGATMLVFAGVAFTLQRRQGLGAFLWSSAVAAHPALVFTTPGFFALIALNAITASESRALSVARIVSGIFLGLAPWIFRNWSQSGSLIFPYSEFFQKGPGWIKSLISFNTFEPAWSGVFAVVLVFGLAALIYSLIHLRFKLQDREVTALVIFGMANSFVAVWRAGLTLPVAVVYSVLAVLGVEYVLTRARGPRIAGLAGWIPYAWFICGLASVSIPVHLFWQTLPQASKASDNYLSESQKHFEAKLWSNIHLPPDSKMTWTWDNEFYYLEIESSSIRDSAILSDALLIARNPAERAHRLCELGIDVLAWEDRHHGPEVAGLASWLRLNKSSTLASFDDVTLFDLHCRK